MAEMPRLFVVTDDGGMQCVRAFSDADIAAFCGDVHRGLWLKCAADEPHHDYYQFSLGFCACLDALASGRVDFEMPSGTVLAAFDDVNDPTVREREVTDAWAWFLEAVDYL